MAIQFKCPKCGKLFKVKDELAGKVASCGCGTKFRIPAPKAKAAPPPKPKAPEPEEEMPLPEDEAPSAKTTISPEDGINKDLIEEKRKAQAEAEDFEEEEPEEDELEDFEEEEPEDAGDELDEEPIEDEPEDEEPESEDEPEEEPEDESEEEEPAAASDDDEEEAEDDDEAEPSAPSSGLPGRILIWLGAALVLAGFFLGWVKLPNTGIKTDKEIEEELKEEVPEVKEDKVESDVEKDIVNDGWYCLPAPQRGVVPPARQPRIVLPDAELIPAGEDAPVDDADAWMSADEAEAMATNEVAGYALPATVAETSPLVYAVYGFLACAVLLAILALIPGKILKGTGQMIVGLVLTLGVVICFVLTLVAVGKLESIGGIGAVFGKAGIGLYLSIGGAVLCLLGGAISSFGVFKAGGAEKPARSRGRGARGARAASRGSTVRMRGPNAKGGVDDNQGGEEPEASGPRSSRAGKKPGKGSRPLRPPAAGKKSGALKPPFAKKKKGKKVSRRAVLKPKNSGGGSSRKK